MFLKNLSLLNFRLCSEQEFEFSEGVNCLLGNNGSGKTNVLDAIHYLSLCKSYINNVDSLQIKEGNDFFMVQGHFVKDQRDEMITCTVKRNQKKQFKRNKKEYDRLSEHIGLFPVVMISPYDTNLIFEGSEERRKFLDNALSQTDPDYLETLIQYNRVLANRNAVLKQNGGNGSVDPILLDVLDEQLGQFGKTLFEKRKIFFSVFEPLFQKHYSFITKGEESVTLEYLSQLKQEGYEEGLQKSRRKDIVLERTSFGIHKDDLDFYLKEMTLKRTGSQGQQKSFLIALKLAHYTYLQVKTGYKPILLLDDIFDKLDEFRVEQLMDMVVRDEFGQIFVTDTHKERIERVFLKINHPFRSIEMENGMIRTFVD